MSNDDNIESINDRLDEFEQRIEETRGEYSQNLGKSIGREVGVLYGIVIALILVIILMKLNII